MNEILLNGINVEELLNRIGQLIDHKLGQSYPLTSLPDAPKFVTRADVAALLKISLPTLNDWTKQGWLQSYKIGNRVLYKLDEIEKAIIKVANHKFKKGNNL